MHSCDARIVSSDTSVFSTSPSPHTRTHCQSVRDVIPVQFSRSRIRRTTECEHAQTPRHCHVNTLDWGLCWARVMHRRWIDLRKLNSTVLGRRQQWPGCNVYDYDIGVVVVACCCLLCYSALTNNIGSFVNPYTMDMVHSFDCNSRKVIGWHYCYYRLCCSMNYISMDCWGVCYVWSQVSIIGNELSLWLDRQPNIHNNFLFEFSFILNFEKMFCKNFPETSLINVQWIAALCAM